MIGNAALRLANAHKSIEKYDFTYVIMKPLKTNLLQQSFSIIYHCFFNYQIIIVQFDEVDFGLLPGNWVLNQEAKTSL